MAMRAAVITASDSGFRGEREDVSGPEAKRILLEAGYEVVSLEVLPDDRDRLSTKMAQLADEGKADLILTTGGTGFSPRDITPEATMDVTERAVPGIPELMRAESRKYTERAALSRAAAGIRGKTLIVNLPGSPKAVRESLEVILPVLGHGLEILSGRTGNCARS